MNQVRRVLRVKALVAVLIIVVLAGAVVVIRHMRARVPATSSWRSLNYPVPDNVAEDAVYSAIIQHLHAEDRLRVVVVRDHTLPCSRVPEWCNHDRIKNGMLKLEPETLDDYVVRNDESASLTKSFNLHRPVMLLSDHDLPKLLIRTNLQINLDSLPSRKINWSLFYDRYPLSPGLISLSRVGFNSQMDQALVYEEIKGSDNGRWGRYLLLAKDSAGNLRSHEQGGWVVRDKIESWVPEQPAPSIQQGEIGTLKGRILDAKAEGLDEVELSSILCGWETGNLRQALARDSLMLARVVGMKTFANEYGLVTWYRFTIVESLSEKPMPNYPGYSSLNPAPPEMQPIGDDEFVIAETNGRMEIDGVKVTQHSNGVNYSPGHTYLIFLHVSPHRVAVRSGTDPLGVFLIGKDGTFTPYIDQPYPLRDQMARRFGNSIENLRRALKN